MPGAPGTLSKVAAVKGATWGTLVNLTSNHRLPVKSTTLDQSVEQVQNDVVTGYAERQSSHLGNKSIGGNLVLVGDYRQGGLLAALMLGVDTSPAEVETDVYLHSLLWQPSLAGLFASIGVDRGGAVVREFHSVKPTRRMLVSQAGGYLEDTYEFIGRGLTKGGSSSDWTYVYSPVDGGSKLILHRHGTFRFNAQSGGALGSGDKVYPTRFELELSRGLTQDFAQAGESEEPIAGDFAEITLRMTFFALDSTLATLFRDAYDAGTLLKGDAVFLDTSGLVGATEFRKRGFYFPKLVVTACPEEIPGPGKVPFTVQMSAHAVAAAPTGFTAAHVTAVVETWQNEIAASFLA